MTKRGASEATYLLALEMICSLEVTMMTLEFPNLWVCVGGGRREMTPKSEGRRGLKRCSVQSYFDSRFHSSELVRIAPDFKLAFFVLYLHQPAEGQPLDIIINRATAILLFWRLCGVVLDSMY